MTASAFQTEILALAAAGLALTGSWFDLRERRIPNWLCLLAGICGLGLAASAGLPELGSHALHAITALLVGMVLFSLGMFGGGDAKFYAGMASLFPISGAVPLLLSVSLSGVVLLSFWFVYRRMRGYKVGFGKATDGASLPYGIAIGAGAVIALLV